MKNAKQTIRGALSWVNERIWNETNIEYWIMANERKPKKEIDTMISIWVKNQLTTASKAITSTDDDRKCRSNDDVATRPIPFRHIQIANNRIMSYDEMNMRVLAVFVVVNAAAVVSTA